MDNIQVGGQQAYGGDVPVEYPEVVKGAKKLDLEQPFHSLKLTHEQIVDLDKSVYWPFRELTLMKAYSKEFA